MPDFNIAGTLGPPIGDINEVMLQGLGKPLRAVVESTVTAYTMVATDDAGDGTVAGDINATDFTGQDVPGGPLATSYVPITAQSIVSFVHKDVLYQYIGSRPVTVGLGGSLTTTAGDYIAQGTADHSLLTNLATSDQHPQNAIIDLLTDQATQDQTFTDHITPATEPDPHVQYLLKTVAVQVFQGLGYGGLSYSTPAPITLTAGWTKVANWDVVVVTSPVNVVQDLLNQGLVLNFAGVWSLSLILILTHDEAQGGRFLGARLFDDTAGVPAQSVDVPVARNQPGTIVAFPLVFELAAPDHLFTLELSALADTFTSVVIAQAQFSVTLNSAYQGALLAS